MLGEDVGERELSEFRVHGVNQGYLARWSFSLTNAYRFGDARSLVKLPMVIRSLGPGAIRNARGQLFPDVLAGPRGWVSVLLTEPHMEVVNEVVQCRGVGMER